jgi:GAF domain-containing protein/C4-dicarboxylate-specific signal transduction histidine kinase
MMNPEIKSRVSLSSQTRLTPRQVANIRLALDLILLIGAFIFLLPHAEVTQVKYVLGAFLGMVVMTIVGYYLIQRERDILGLGFLIYGFILSMLAISIFVERIGMFAGILMILGTILTTSTSMPSRRGTEAAAASVVLGFGSLLFDIFSRDTNFRLTISDQLETTLGLVTFIISGVLLVLIIRQFQYFSLRAKLTSAFILGAVVALATLGFFNNRSVQQVLTEEANQSLFNAASQAEVSLRQFMDFNLESIKTEANLPVFVSFLALPESEQPDYSEEVFQTLQTLADQENEYLLSYALLDLKGNVLIDTDMTHVEASEASMYTFIEAINQGTSVMSPVLVDPFTGEPSIYFSSPVVESGTTILGVLRIRFHADVLQDLITSNNGRGGEGSFAVLFDENLIHLAHGTAPETIFTTVMPLDLADFQQLVDSGRLPDQSPASTFLNLPDLEENLLTAKENSAVFFEATDVATGDKINRVVVLNMGDPPWLLAFFQPQEIFLAPSEELAQSTVVIALISMAGAVALALVLTQIIVAPIINLTQKANQLAGGNFEERVEINTKDEIGELGQSFNSMSYQLQNLVTSLESQVADRTKELENRAAQLQASAEVARDATSELELQPMLDRAATLIHDRFGYYHVGIYLKDGEGEFAVLAASIDDAGRKLLQSEHHYRINPENNVGYACILGQPILANADENTASLNFNPILAGSQSQLVLPLNLGKETIGAIDIHSTNPIAFTNNEEQIFQTLADQLAIAIEKARVQEKIRETLSELETAYGSFTRASWQRFVQSRQNISGYLFNRNKKVIPIEKPSAEVVQAWKRGEQVNHTRRKANSRKENAVLAIPIKVRGSVIGVLDVEFEESKVPADTSNLIREISERLSLILENARLIESAQRMVQRERLTSEISNRFRQSLDLDVVLRTAVEEIGEKLGLAEVELRIGDQEQVTLEKVNQENGNRPQSSEEAA